MNTNDGRGLYLVTYEDNALDHYGPQVIHTSGGLLQELALRLLKDYKNYNLGGNEGLCGDYLIGGVLMSATRSAHSSEDVVDILLLRAESKTSLEFLAEHFKLPEIPEQSFVRQ